MKKILFAVLLSVCAGCSELLEENPKSIATETFYNTYAEGVSAVNAAYWAIISPEFDSYFTLLETLSDNVFGKGSLAVIEEYQGYSPANIGNMDRVWTTLYTAVRNANLVIRNVPRGTLTSDTQKASLIGEARFVRAFSYFALVRLWGRVPLRTEENLGQVDIPRSTKEDIYSLIVADLTYAEQNLPDTPRMLGTASRWIAKTLLADVYLTTESWNNAMVKAEEVITSGKFALVPVSKPEDFQKIYGADVISTPEEIFYFKYNDQVGWSIMNFFHISGSGYKPYGANYFSFYTTSDHVFYKNWDNTDLRKIHNHYSWDIGLGNNTYLFKKFIDPAGVTQASNDWPVYRYPEVLLIYAEAANKVAKGPTSKAVEYLNQVHRRAYGYVTSAPSPVDFKLGDYNEVTFDDLVFQEKAYETLVECKRWLDLVRTGRAAKAIKETTGKTLDAKMLLWPIPTTEINYNKALDPAKDQNPGY